jgi:tetratricopeptide (TPR) repeat protein
MPGRFFAALVLIASLAWMMPAGIPAAVEKARSLSRAGKREAAEQVLRDAIRSGDGAPDVRAELGALLVARRRFAEAVEQFGLAAQQDPKNLEYAVGLAGALIADKRFSVAAEYLRAVRDQFEKDAQYHHQLGLAYWGLHNFPAALAEFQAASRLDPKLDVALFFAGNCHAVLGDLPAAVEAYRTAIRQNPRAVSYRVALGKVLDRMGPEHAPEAVSTLREALRLSPGDIPSKFALALVLEKTGRPGEAVRLLEEVSARYPDELPPHIALVRLYTKLNNPDRRVREAAEVRRLQAIEARKRSTAEPGRVPSIE